jgi:hypothetical protein
MSKYLILFILLMCGGGILYTASTILVAMEAYPGGTILDRSSIGYELWNNYLSDLGRRRAWNGLPNQLSNLAFDRGLYVAAGSIVLFFFLFARLVVYRSRSYFAAVAVVALGSLSALAYLGIAWYPLDVNYRMHTIFVRVGFISFWLLGFVFASKIRRQPDYPNIFAYLMWIFLLVFFIQISIMLFGPRAWSSPDALRLQVSAQKVIVVAQLSVMLLQILGLSWFVFQNWKSHPPNVPYSDEESVL